MAAHSSRRSFTAITGLAALGAAVGATFGSTLGLGVRTAQADDSTTSPPPTPAAAPTRALRFAHCTDIHMTPNTNAFEGTARALNTVHATGAQMILTGGDLVMDSFATPRAMVDSEWVLFHKVFAEHCTIPVEHCLGNHDILGWCKSKAQATGSESDFGYARALSELKLSSRWRSFDRNGWHFIVLSSVEPDPKDECGYLARLNPQQRAWLQADLAANKLPTVVVSHIPIVSITSSMRGGDQEKAQKTEISGGSMHLDANTIHSMFRKSGHVKLVLSGHMHLIDQCTADGITYACSGAVCGGWWKKNANHCDPTFALIDLFADGTFHYEMRNTEWVIA